MARDRDAARPRHIMYWNLAISLSFQRSNNKLPLAMMIAKTTPIRDYCIMFS